MKKYFVFVILLFINLSPISTIAQKTPNVVIIFIDDMGFGDLVCYEGLEVSTPNIDQMAREGMRFTNFLSAQAVCSASRAGLLTGCYPNRIGFSGALGPNAEVGISNNEVTIAEMLKQKNYATAIYGKWHLGHLKQFLPLQHGFDEYVGLPYSNDMWPVNYDGNPSVDWKKDGYPTLPLIKGNEPMDYIRNLDDQSKLTTIYTENAVNFINKNKNKPFFLYVPHSMVHVPIAVSDKFKGKSGYGLWADMMLEVDWSVGEILKSLKNNGLEENTLVVLTSDNGPWLNFGNHAGSSGGFREGKGTSYEGGQRVPAIVKWKGRVPEGVVCNQLASTIDILPTIADITSTNLPEHKIDGVSLLELFEGNLEAKPRKYFNYYYRRNSLEAVRRDNWKLVLNHLGRSYKNTLPGKDGFPGPSPENTVETEALYDLRRDPGEDYDVKLSYPEIYKELLEYAEKVKQDLGDDITKVEGNGRRPIGKI